MMDVLTTVGTAIALTKQLMDVADVAKDAKAKMAVADLQLQLAEIKCRLADLIEENRTLKALKDEAPKLTFRDGGYYQEDGAGPFCSGCFDTSKRLVRLHEATEQFRRAFGRWKCPACSKAFK